MDGCDTHRMEGYDAKFDPPLTKRLECPICLLALREPMQTPCGHRFCSPCITRALGETGKRCPVDNTPVDHQQLFKDNFAKREVLCLNVLCSANEHGCLWHGELRDLQTHSQLCELIHIDCPHKCGHASQRKFISSHLISCPNKPQCCAQCSIAFVLDKLEEHKSHCSKLKVPKSILSDVSEANEVLKWTGHIKLKMNKHQGNPPYIHFTGYLTAKAETPESYMQTGNWCSHLNVMTLNTGASQVFQDTLKSPEVVCWQFFFQFLVKDKTHIFTNLLKGKSGDQGAAVGLHLKSNSSRQDLTVMYFHWSEQKKRVMATVADLSSHTVRHIHTRLQSLQQNSRRSRSSASHSRGGHSSRSYPPPSAEHRQHHNFHRGAPVRSAPHPHMHHQLHPSHPPPTTILPHLLSWQTSQSFNTYPWRVQNNVPFFTFPSTPPQYLPANSYPYTFAPLPAAPFSISPMQPVVTHALPVPMTNEHVPVAVTLGNPNPSAVVSVNVIQQPVIHGPTVDTAPSQDLAIIHGLGPTHQHFQAAHVAPVPLVPTDPGVIQNRPPVALPNAAHVISLEQPNIGMAVNQPNGNTDDMASARTRIWMPPEAPTPSNRQPVTQSENNDSDSSVTSSPRNSLSPMFYADSDTLDTSPMMESPQVIFRGIPQHDSFSSHSSTDSPLQTLATAALELTDSPQSEPGPSTGSSSEGGPLRLPVLINISDSDIDSNATTPSSVIDLTSSPGSVLVTPSIHSQSEVVSEEDAPPMLVPVIHDREGQSSSRRALNFNQETQPRYSEGTAPPMAVPPGSILATAPPAMLGGGILNGAHHPPAHPIVAVGPSNTLAPGMAIPTGNVQVLGWQPTFEAPPPQPHPPPAAEVPMGGHLNILVPPSVVPGQAFPPAVIPQQPPRGEFWERVMPSLDMTLQNGTGDPRPNQ